MIKKLSNHMRAVASVALGRQTAGRNLTVFPDDVFLVSYLRSGSTWFRFLVGNLMNPGGQVTFVNVKDYVPFINDHPDRVLRRLPRVLKSHEYFDPRYPRVILAVRDPRDVAVSFYYYNKKVRVIPDDYPMDAFLDRWLKAQVVGYADRLGTWEDHTLSWVLLRKHHPDFLLIRYEDMIETPEAELKRMAAFLKIPVTPEAIRHAVQASSAREMRSLETKQKEDWVTTRGTRSDIPFVREAKSGTWQKKLTPAQVARIEAAWGNTMRMLGYELVSVPVRTKA